MMRKFLVLGVVSGFFSVVSGAGLGGENGMVLSSSVGLHIPALVSAESASSAENAQPVIHIDLTEFFAGIREAGKKAGIMVKDVQTIVRVNGREFRVPLTIMESSAEEDDDEGSVET